MSPLKKGAKWARKDVVLQDDTRSQSIRCKLWGQTSDTVGDDDVDKKVTVTNVNVDIYHDVHSLDSTDLTKINVSTNQRFTKTEH